MSETLVALLARPGQRSKVARVGARVVVLARRELPVREH
jgi:hypothetical protein